MYKSYHIYHNIPGTFCSGCHPSYPWLLVALMTPSMGHLRASQPYVTGFFSNFACKALGFQQLFILVTWTAKLFMWKADKSMICETLDFIVGCQHLCCPWSHSKKCLEGASGASCEASSFTRTWYCHIVHQGQNPFSSMSKTKIKSLRPQGCTNSST